MTLETPFSMIVCEYLPLFQSARSQMVADVKEDFLSNFLYIWIIFKWQIHKDDLSKLNFRL